PDRKEEQKQAFRRFVANLPQGDHSLKVTEGGFQWDQVEVPVGRGEVGALQEQVRAHGVGEIRPPSGLMTSTLPSPVRMRAAPKGPCGSFDHLSARVDSARRGVIAVVPVPESLRLPVDRNPGVEPSGRPASKVDDGGHSSAIGPDALTEEKV